MAKKQKEVEEVVVESVGIATPETITVEQVAVAPISPIVDGKVTVDAKLFVKMIKCLVMNKVTPVAGVAAIRIAGEMMGCKTYAECLENWELLKQL